MDDSYVEDQHLINLDPDESFSPNLIENKSFGRNPKNFLLGQFSESFEYKEGRLPGIRDVSAAVLRTFAPAATEADIQKSVELAAWRTFGHGSDRQAAIGSPTDKDEDQPPDPTLLFTSAAALLLEEKPEYLDLSCPLLNQVLRGGLLKGTVTEITGESSSGKTQVCLHAAAVTALSGQSVIYLQTEARFPVNRLAQIINTRVTGSGESALNRVLVKKIRNFVQFEQVLDAELELIIKDRSVSLVIIDSIAALFRGDGDIETAFERIDLIQRFGMKIKALTARLKLAVIVVNQVADAINYPGFTYGRSVIPCLGHLWTNYINTRLFLTNTDYLISRSQLSAVGADLPGEARLRSLEIDFSSYLPEDMFNFIITPSGIMGIQITQ